MSSSSMWRRLPCWFPNLRLQMLPITAEQKAEIGQTGWLREAAFKCEPRTTKLEIKAFLETVHGMQVEKVSTINYQGKKKKQIDFLGKPHYYRRSDWKKAYVLFKPPEQQKQKWLDEQEQRQQEHLEQLKAAALSRSRLPNFLPAAAAALAREIAPAVTQTASSAIAKAAERQAKELRPFKPSVAITGRKKNSQNPQKRKRS